tara:strand:+ start:350 stop:640 length:291 start_codon:yes stop_codon:yes gene_type:complete
MKKKKTMGSAVAAAMGHSLSGAFAKEMNHGRPTLVDAASTSAPRQKQSQSPSAHDASSIPTGGHTLHVVLFAGLRACTHVGPGTSGSAIRSTACSA